MTLKEIVTLPAEAKFVHAIAGTLYYRITTDDVVVEFPIANETLLIVDKSKLR